MTDTSKEVILQDGKARSKTTVSGDLPDLLIVGDKVFSKRGKAYVITALDYKIIQPSDVLLIQ